LAQVTLKKEIITQITRVYYGETVKAGVGLRLAWRLFLNFESWHSVYDEYDEDRAFDGKDPQLSNRPICGKFKSHL
jgi:hypothetical protein